MATQIINFLVLGFVVRMSASSTLSSNISTIGYRRISSPRNVLEKLRRVSALHCAGYCSTDPTCYGFTYLIEHHICHITGSAKGDMINVQFKAYRKEAPWTLHKESNKTREVCTSEACKAPHSVNEDDRSRCILQTRENLSDVVSENMNLTFSVKEGMKITVHAAYYKDLRDSQMTVTKDPKRPDNIMKWFHVRPLWKTHTIWLTDGLTQSGYNGSFPISDPSNFTLAVELTSSSTKIYAEKALLIEMDLIPEIREIYLRRFSKVYRLVVQKTEEGCDKVDNGIPRSLQYP